MAYSDLKSTNPVEISKHKISNTRDFIEGEFNNNPKQDYRKKHDEIIAAATIRLKEKEKKKVNKLARKRKNFNLLSFFVLGWVVFFIIAACILLTMFYLS